MAELPPQNTESIKKKLYYYQAGAIDEVFKRIKTHPKNFRLLYQLPTGGGKTVIFSEIVRRFIKDNNQKVVVLTHRIELCKQTSKMLDTFDVPNKIINSTVKELGVQDDQMCYVAMVETLNNRLKDDKVDIDDVGLVIVDEAHYNSFRKLLNSFGDAFILGVTATPLSSNNNTPMYETYNELTIGESIQDLVDNGFLARPTTYSYDVGLGTLKIGINGDYTVKSSDELYTNLAMQEKLVHAYLQHAKGKKTLIFNNGIRTSLQVVETFKEAGIHIRHLDNTNSAEERKDILKWFKNTPDAILSSVGILTTGFDEPTVEVIMLNRATKSLTLYLQMIGRGSRRLPKKDSFTIVDLGNNVARFGLWTDKFNWYHIFKHPEHYISQLRNDAEIEESFVYKMPPEVRKLFKKSDSIEFDVEACYKKVLASRGNLKQVLDLSIQQHAQMCVDNATCLQEAKGLVRYLHEDVEDRVRVYVRFMAKSTKNYREWLIEDYLLKLNSMVGKIYRLRMMDDED